MRRKIRAVFFDAGNTLLYLDYLFIVEKLAIENIKSDAEAVRCAEYRSRRALDEAMASGSVREEDIWSMYFNGILSESGMKDKEKRQRTIERIKERNDYFSLWVYVPDEVRETLSQLRKNGYKLGIISNSDGSLETLLEKTELAPMVDFALDSFVVGSEKPNPEIFQIALKKTGEPPEACIHVGDIEAADVAGAYGVGIHPVLLDPGGEKSTDCDVISSIPEIFDVLDRLNME